MSVLFCHDHRFFVDTEGRFYSYGQFDHTILNRYVGIFGSVTVAARGVLLSEGDDVTRLSPCSSENINFVWMPNLSSLRGLTLDRVAAREKMDKAVSEADFVIARLPSEIGLMALGAAKRLHKRAAAEIVACVWDGLNSHGSFFARLYAPVAYWRMKRTVAKLGWCHYVTQNFLQQRYPSKGETLAASDADLAPPDEGILTRRLNNLTTPKKPPVFGMIAALFHKEKGIDVAIKAFAIAKKTIPDIRLKVLGPGDSSIWREYAKQHDVGNSIEFCGSLPRGEAVLNWLDGIDIYIQASFQEGLPRALLEAMSRACPALASSAGGTEELVPAECLHIPGDTKKLANQMLQSIDLNWRTQMATLNFLKSKNYVQKILNARRNEFWDRFSKSL